MVASADIDLDYGLEVKFDSNDSNVSLDYGLEIKFNSNEDGVTVTAPDSWDMYNSTGLFRIKSLVDGYLLESKGTYDTKWAKLVIYNQGDNPTLLGYFHPILNEIGLQDGDYNQMNTTALHEIDHQHNKGRQENDIRMRDANRDSLQYPHL